MVGINHVVLRTVIEILVRFIEVHWLFVVNLCPIVLGLVSTFNVMLVIGISMIVRLFMICGPVIPLLVLVRSFFISELFVENMVMEVVTILVLLIVKMRCDVLVRMGIGVVAVVVMDWVYIVLHVVVVTHLMVIELAGINLVVSLVWVDFELVFVTLMLPIVGVTVSVLIRCLLFL